ncbi:MAG: copper-binding protein [Rhodocyclaceae bacterium]|nr:copper-binding protein [Rhodocyclaceae bacterium]MBX3670951.1 copper-binding protein [Rhodocyclaceae bacterium]
MKNVLAILSVAVLAATAAPAIAADSGQMNMNHSGMNHGAGMAHDGAMPMAKMSEGTIKKVDKAAGKITIAHGSLENLNMPGMTMAFAVKDKAMLDQVKVGDKVHFVADSVNGALIVTKLESAK